MSARPPSPPPATWRALEAIPLFLVAQVGAVLIAAPLLALSDSCPATFLTGHLALRVSFVASTLAWIRYVSRASPLALGVPREPLKDAAGGVAIGLALVVLGLFALAATRAAATAVLGHEPPEAQQVDACVRGVSLALGAPLIILVVPIGEEFFFRGFLYKGLRRRFSVWPAALVSAVAFAVVHVNPESAREAGATALLTPGLFVVGVGLALLYERRQSLLAPIAGHAMFNLVGYLAIALGRI